MPNPDLPSAGETFANLTVEELTAARDALFTLPSDEDATVGPVWAALELRLAELGA